MAGARSCTLRRPRRSRKDNRCKREGRSLLRPQEIQIRERIWGFGYLFSNNIVESFRFRH